MTDRLINRLTGGLTSLDKKFAIISASKSASRTANKPASKSASMSASKLACYSYFESFSLKINHRLGIFLDSRAV